MKPSFFSGYHLEKIQVEFCPIFFRLAKAPIFSKSKIGYRLNGRLTHGQVCILHNPADNFCKVNDFKDRALVDKLLSLATNMISSFLYLDIPILQFTNPHFC